MSAARSVQTATIPSPVNSNSGSTVLTATETSAVNPATTITSSRRRTTMATNQASARGSSDVTNWLGQRECGALLKRDEIKTHRCGFSKCRLCGEYTKPEDHQCFMQKVKPLDSDINPTFIVFDLETQQCREYKQTELGPMFLHEPNLCIAYKFCDNVSKLSWRRKTSTAVPTVARIGGHSKDPRR